MSSLTNYSCKKCLERQEELLEEGDGSQVVCLCPLDEISDEAMQQFQIPEDSSSTSQIEDSVDPDNVEFAISTTQSSTSNSSLRTPQLGEKNVGKMQPPSLKRKRTNFSIISTEEFQPSLKRQLFLGSFPSNEEFNECLKSATPSYPIRKWKELPLHHIFKVNSLNLQGAGFNPYVAELLSQGEEIFKVWVNERIYNRLKDFDLAKKCVFIKSNGLKPCKNNSLKQYFDFDIISKDL